MKKMMVLAGAMMLAAITQASSVYWTCAGVYAGNATDKVSGIAYFVNSETISAAALKAECAKGAAAVEEKLDGSYNWTPTTAGSYLKGTAAKVDVADLGLADDTSYAGLYLAIFDGSTIANSTKMYVTQELSGKTLTGTNSTQIKWGTQSASQSASAWTAVGVPEPTSGLLLLLGMAGLALKRKQA